MSKVTMYKCDRCGETDYGSLIIGPHGNRYYPIGWVEVKRPVLFYSGKHLCRNCRREN